MQLLDTQNQEILAILGAPENLPIIREAIGLNDFFVPGEDDVEKCYDDIKQLVNSTPIPTGDAMMPEVPSVEVDPDFENPEVTFEIVRKWVIGEVGRQTKMDNPEGYRNVLLYGKQLKQLVMQQQMMAAMQGQGANPEKPNENTEAPITGEENVATV